MKAREGGMPGPGVRLFMGSEDDGEDHLNVKQITEGEA